VLYDRNIIGTSSEIFAYLRQCSENVRKMFGDVCQAFGTILKNLRKSSESDRKSSESSQKHRYWHAYIMNRMIHGRLAIWNLSSRVHIRYLTRSPCSLVRYRCEHSKINSISPRVHLLFSIYSIGRNHCRCYNLESMVWFYHTLSHLFYLWYGCVVSSYSLFMHYMLDTWGIVWWFA